MTRIDGVRRRAAGLVRNIDRYQSWTNERIIGQAR
jgi:hypothetical protein